MSILCEALTGKQLDYFYFSKGPDDDPISWNFRCRWSPQGKMVTHKADTPAEDSMIATLMNTNKLELKQYQPGLYSPLALVLGYTLSDNKDAFPKIEKLEFGIEIEHTGDPPVPGLP